MNKTMILTRPDDSPKVLNAGTTEVEILEVVKQESVINLLYSLARTRAISRADFIPLTHTDALIYSNLSGCLRSVCGNGDDFEI